MDKLTRELLAETTVEDITEKYRSVVNVIGIELFAELGDYAKGDELYFPQSKTIIIPARNRRIIREFDGGNMRMLSKKYGLTLKQIKGIINGTESKKT